MNDCWWSVEDIAQDAHRRHGLPIGVCRRLVELEFLRLQDGGVAVIRTHLAHADRETFLDSITNAVAV